MSKLEVVYVHDVPVGVGYRVNSVGPVMAFRMLGNGLDASDTDFDVVEIERLMRLFAASEDMYEALKGLEISTPQDDDQCHRGVCRMEQCGHCRRRLAALNAIAKAEKRGSRINV